MGKPKKLHAADDVQENALHGHNGGNEALFEKVMGRFHEQQVIIDAAKELQKALLREGKEGGLLKKEMRGAYKEMMMTSEQRQASDEGKAAREEYKKLCEEIGIFDQMEE